MKVFISWSGETSKKLAEALHDWIPNVIQSAEPYMSAEDIRQGSRWFADISTQLEEARFGVLCLTPENLDAPWLLFEAGALSKFVDASLVVPYLFNLYPSDLQGPLAQFQATRADKESTRKMMNDLNATLEDQRLGEARLDSAFERCWPELEQALDAIEADTTEASSPRSERDTREILEEILEVVRHVSRQSSEELPEIKSMLRLVRNSVAHTTTVVPTSPHPRQFGLRTETPDLTVNAGESLSKFFQNYFSASNPSEDVSPPPEEN